MSCMIDCIKSGHFWLFFIQLFFSVHLHVSFCEQLHFQFESAMKIILVFVAACALFSTVHSAPFDSVVKSQDGDTKEFHFYDKAAKQDDELVRDLIADAMQSQDDPNSVETQGWFTNALKRYGPGALKLANSLVNGGYKIQEENKNAKEQHSFNFDEKAAKQ